MHPAWVEGSKLSMDVMKKYMDIDESVKSTYASVIQNVNYWKNRQGMIDALTIKLLKLSVNQKKDLINGQTKKPIKQLTEMSYQTSTHIIATNDKAKHDNYLISILRSSKFSILPYRLGSGFKRYTEANENQRNGMKERLAAFIEDAYTDYHLPLEKEILVEQLKLYVSKSIRPSQTVAAYKDNGFDAYVDAIFNSVCLHQKNAQRHF